MRHLLLRLALAVLFFALFPAAMRAQRASGIALAGATSAVLEPAADGSLVPLAAHSLRLVGVRDGAERQLGTYHDEITATTANGEPALLCVVTVTSPRGTLIDSTVVRRRDLAPVWHRSRNAQRTMALEFAGARVTGSYTPTDSAPKTFTYEADRPLYDSAIIDLVLAALPLREGFTARIPAYVYERGGLTWVEARVDGTTTVYGHLAWRVPMSFEGRVVMVWLIDTRSRELLGWTSTAPDGGVTKVLP